MVPAGRQQDVVAVLAQVLGPDGRIGGANEEGELGRVAELLHLLDHRHAVGRRGQREHGVGMGGFRAQDQVREVLGARRVLRGDDHLVASGLAGLRPRRGHLASPVGLFLEDGDGLRALAGGDRGEHRRQRLADVGRLPERREEIAEALLVHLVERERHAEVRGLVLLGHRGGRRVQVGAEAAEVRDDALGGQRLQARHGLRRVGLVVQQHELERHFLAGQGDAAGGVDVLDRDLVAGAHLRAAGSVASGHRHHGTDSHGLCPGRQRQREQCEHEHPEPPHA